MITWRDLGKGYVDRIESMRAMKPRELLGISQDATASDIKSAYVRLIKAYHPDRADPFMVRYNEEVSKLINAAYEQLKDSS